MSKMYSLIAWISTALSLIALPAMAQVSAQELWTDWQAQAQATGQTMTAAVDVTGNGLILQDLTSVAEKDGVTTTAHVDQITLTEQPDGSVTVAVSEVYQIGIAIEDDDGRTATLGFDMRHSGLSVTVSGPREARRYVYSADSLILTDSAMLDADGLPVDLDLRVEINGLFADYLVNSADPNNPIFTSATSFDEMAGRLDAHAPVGEDGRLKFGFAMTNALTTSSGTIGDMLALSSGMTGLPEGFEVTASLDFDSFTYALDFEDPDQAFSISGSNGDGGLAFFLPESSLRFAMTGADTRMELRSSDLPVPVDISADASDFQIEFPLTASPEPGEIAFMVSYEGLQMNEAIWALFDQTGAIPRDPVSLLLDVGGTVQLFNDLANPNIDFLSGPPGEVRGLTLNHLLVRAAGAELTGEGGLSFPPGQIVPFPAGSISLHLAGGYALLDRLVAGGLMTDRDAAMSRGMSGLFARPGSEPDTLRSTIEFTSEGGITANGMPLQ